MTIEVETSSKPTGGFFLQRRFLPLFVTQFLGAFNDNLFRQAIIILITFKLAEQIGMSAGILNNMAIGLFILPYFLFSALAGQLADKYEKTGQIFWIKIWEVMLMVVGAFALYFESLPLLIAVLSGLGLQSTFFGPIKYGVLPDLMKENELLSANALIEAGTFIAILLGTIVGGFLMLKEGGWQYVAGLTIAAAITGVLFGRKVPKTGQAAPDIQISKNIFASTGRQLKVALGTAVTRRSIIAISWIWLYGSLYISQMPIIAKDHLNGDASVVTLFMACFSVGIGIGSMLCSKLLKGNVSARLAKPALIILIALSGLLYLLMPAANPQDVQLTLGVFLSDPFNILIATILTATAMATGAIIVPMYTILQEKSARGERSQMIAANNIINSGFMASGAIGAVALLSLGFSTAGILLVIGLGNLLIIPIVSRLDKSL